MCGITGISPANEELLSKMNVCLAHRGPDWSGVFNDKHASIGHTLLAIRDVLDVSKQPILSEGKWICSFNGQIYNTKQLIPLLDNLDSNKIDSDTYILGKLIEKFGWNFIEYIRGMFAIALYNPKEKIIKLYRDPSGQKCLYYHQKDGQFIFASEIAALENCLASLETDPEGVFIAASLGYIPGRKTLFKNINKVQPSEIISWNINDQKISSEYYKHSDPNYFSQDINLAFSQLIKEHLQSKQRISINLSGGMDSSLLLHEMKSLGYDIHSYSTKFDIENSNINKDAELAKKLATDYGADHTEINITKELFWKNFVDSYSIIEEPNYNISLPIYFLTAQKEGINGDKNRVVLSGDGGDEIFGGYPIYKESLRFSKIEKFLTPYVFSFIKNKRSGTDFKLFDADERWLFFKNFNENWSKNQNLKFLKTYIKESTGDWINLYMQKSGPVYDLMLRDRILWMAGENFIRTDKLYMHESLEMRAPLSYSPFREYVDNKIKNNEYVGETNKVFLRKIYENKLPDYIVKRPDKTGWRAPVAEWYDTKSKKLYLDILSSQYLVGNLIDWPELRKKISTSDKWPGKNMHLYLSLAILAEKYKINI